HRLRLLDVDWGVPAEAGRSRGTFRETWTLAWRPEFDVELIEASAWGTTVRGAATARAEALAAGAAALADLTSVAERCLLADLGDALPTVMRALADRAAVDTDVAHLMSAMPALVRALRYGDVRGTSTGPLRTVVDGLVVRICVGLPPAITGLDDGAAREFLGHVDAVHAALSLLADEGHVERWRRTLEGLVARPESLHGLIEGRLTRLLPDAGRLRDGPDRLARAGSAGGPPARAAARVGGVRSVWPRRRPGRGVPVGRCADPHARRGAAAPRGRVDRRAAGRLVHRRAPPAAPHLRLLRRRRAPRHRGAAARPRPGGRAVPPRRRGRRRGPRGGRDRNDPAHPRLGGIFVSDGTATPEDDRLRRWRLVLGGGRADGTGVTLAGDDARMDGALEKLYGAAGEEGRSRRRGAGLGDSAPSVARWLGDIREYFPSSVVQVMQKDAIE